ncbi:hypothetical protein BC827DRAFT_824782 [Russula dissimulans]|nr:hypothetical protein BC827DRAFT_824782 [Russula dissimulans]
MSIFYDVWGENRDPPLSAFQQAFWILDDGHFDGDEDASPALIEELVFLSIPERHFVAFFVQSMLCVKLHLEATQSDTEPPLLAPLLPHIEPSSCYDEPFELGTTSSLRPWLRDGLAGTPFAGLSTTRGTPWAGYYTTLDALRRDPPMFLELLSAEAPRNANPSHVYFRGEGHDGVGTFTIEGSCNTLLGMVDATKVYATHSWEWRGVITPFGMVGAWGESGWSCGWWWIWPRAWSE